MGNWLNTQIVKDQKPAGPLTARSEKGTFYTQRNDSTYDWVNSQPGMAGTGTIHLDPNSGGPWGTYIVNRGSTVVDKEKRLSEEALQNHLWNINNLKFEEEKPFTWEEFKKNFSDWAKERGLIKADGGKVEKAENGTKTPTALSGRNYWEGFKARNEALWDKVKNNTFVNMIAPVKDLSEGNTEAILPWIATRGMSQQIVGLSKAAPVKAGSKEFKTIINQNPQIPKWNNPERLTYRQGADKVEFGPTGDDFTVIPKIRKKIANQLTKDLHSGKYNSEGLERIVAGPDGLYGIKPQNKEPIFFVNGKEDWIRNFLERLKIKKQTGGQLSFKNGGKISDLLNNQEFLVNLEKCGGKMKKKACGGKMKKKK